MAGANWGLPSLTWEFEMACWKAFGPNSEKSVTVSLPPCWGVAARLGESERRHLGGALVEVTSLNLRNRVAHGQIDRATDADYVVLFHIACWLRLLKVTTPQT